MRSIFLATFFAAIALPAAAQTTTTYEYDSAGRLAKVAQSGSTPVRYLYDKADNRRVVSNGAALVLEGYDEFPIEWESWVQGSSWYAIGSVSLTKPSGGYYRIAPKYEIGNFFGGSFDGEQYFVTHSGNNIYGDWRLIEELQSGGTDHVLANGTWTGESGVWDEYYGILTFYDFPYNSGLAANESGAVTIRIEIRRTSGDSVSAGIGGGVLPVAWWIN